MTETPKPPAKPLFPLLSSPLSVLLLLLLPLPIHFLSLHCLVFSLYIDTTSTVHFKLPFLFLSSSVIHLSFIFDSPSQPNQNLSLSLLAFRLSLQKALNPHLELSLCAKIPQKAYQTRNRNKSKSRREIEIYRERGKGIFGERNSRRQSKNHFLQIAFLIHSFMGCSASRSHTLLTRPTEDQQPPSNPSSSSFSSSWYSDSNSTPISRTLSLPTPLVHHPPLRKGDTNHLVSLTSTTYGSLVLIDPIANPKSNPNLNSNRSSSPSHISKTLTLADPKEPSSPDSVINTWELMEGLDDFDFDFVQKPNSSFYDSGIESPKKPNSYQCMDCNGSVKKGYDSFDSLNSFEIVEHPDSKPLWKHLSEESLLAKMDPNVVSSYRLALSSKRLGCRDTQPKTIRPVESGTKSSLSPSNQFDLQGTEDKIVLYYTSLRGIRRTYEDCCAVRLIFRGFRVYVDERDISMDSAYKKELQSVLVGKVVTLPQVFIGGKYVGGADEIKQLHECGELGKLLEGFPVRDLGYVCDSCGDARFLPCPNCNGSKKVFKEEEGKLRRCPDCNENGLIRCPGCCS